MMIILKKYIRTILTVCLALLEVFALSGCKNANQYEILFSSVFELSVGNDENSIYGVGTGFKYKAGEIITNYHVVGLKKDGNDITYSYIKGKIYGGYDYILFDVSSFSYEDDYAILIPKKDFVEKFDKINVLDIDDSNGLKIGEECYTIGNLFNYGLAINEGIISSGLKKLEYKGKQNTFIQTTIEIAKGSSGGPLFNSKNKVIGLCAFKLRDKNMDYVDGISFFIPIYRLLM